MYISKIYKIGWENSGIFVLLLLCPKVIIMIIRRNSCLKHSMNMTFFYQCTGTQGCWNQHLLQQSQAPRERLCAGHQDAVSILKKVECPLLWFYQLCKICLRCVRISADLQWHIIYMILFLPFKSPTMFLIIYPSKNTQR